MQEVYQQSLQSSKNMSLKTIYLIAGETSGDFMGAKLMKEIKKRHGDSVKLVGVGGYYMEKEGLSSLFPISKIDIMGLAEVLPKIPVVLKSFNDIVKDILAKKPDIIVTLDATGFNKRVIKKLNKHNYNALKIQYGAPTVWMYKNININPLKGIFDRILCIFPNEPKYFNNEGIKADFVGNHLLEQELVKAEDSFLQKYNIDKDKKLVLFLPGSRNMELKKLAPIFLNVYKKFTKHEFFAISQVRFVLVPHLKEKAIKKYGIPKELIIDFEDRYKAFAQSSLAVVASGSVTLELGLYKVPTIVAYKISKLTEYILKKKINVKYATLFNIFNDEMIIPEFLQENCTEENIFNQLVSLLTTSKDINVFDSRVKQTLLEFGYKNNPTEKATDIILSELFKITTL